MHTAFFGFAYCVPFHNKNNSLHEKNRKYSLWHVLANTIMQTLVLLCLFDIVIIFVNPYTLWFVFKASIPPMVDFNSQKQNKSK